MKSLPLPSLLLSTALALSGCGDSSYQVSGDTDPDPDTTEDDTDVAVNTCVDPDGDTYGPGCAAGLDCDNEDPATHAGATEVCGDERDNDCDGVIDQGCACADGTQRGCFTGPAERQGIGTCRAGVSRCVDTTWGPCEHEVLPEDERCDGLDNDCDGDVDEGVQNACGGCGDVPVEQCDDALDNDCDGLIDEADAGCACDGRTQQPCYGGPPETLGVAACRGGVMDCACPGGAQSCTDGAWGACEGQVLPHTEVCDGLDNDCDGLIDEGVANACGGCGDVAIETCDHVDNDCDGLIDEALADSCGRCPGDVVPDEVCDGLDNDCDGQLDEGCGCAEGDTACYTGPADRAGVGACAMGVRACDDTGELWLACEGSILPSVELCDGVDNDCDGQIDIGADGCSVCGSDVEVCDGLDNDCDGAIDEGVRNTCGECLDAVVPEEDGGQALCNGLDDDCDGLTDEGLVNACGLCGESCYTISYGAGDWQRGTANGLSEDRLPTVLSLGGTFVGHGDLWVANMLRGEVYRVDTTSGTHIGTYPVGADPSRTAVDFNGDVWVANRAFSVGHASVTHVRRDGCTGDACVAATVNVGERDAIARGVAVDAEGFVWVGTYTGETLYRINPDTDTVVEEHNVGIPVYGIAIDSEGIIWISSFALEIEESVLGAFDTNTRSMVGTYHPGGCFAPYGIAIDRDGNVWVSNHNDCQGMVRFDRAAFEAGSSRFDRYTDAALSYVRGIAVDADGILWMVATNSDRLGRFDPSVNAFTGTFATCTQPTGVAIAPDHTIWTTCYGDAAVWQHDDAGNVLAQVRIPATGSYTYSDMTGFALNNFTAPRGSWRHVFDCGFSGCSFDEATWTATVPFGTSVSVRGRTSADAVSWGPWSESFRVSPADLSSAALVGRYLELEVLLATTTRDLTPTVDELNVSWQRP